MFAALGCLIEGRKEIILGVSLSLLYLTYYLFEVVKKPLLVCGDLEFRTFLEQNVELVQSRYWPTPWCVEARLQTVLGSLLRSVLLPRVRCRRQTVALADGGTVALDWVEEGAGTGERGVLLVLPGLSGDVHADYARSLAAAARELGLECAVLTYRGLGGLALTSPRLYSALSHADVGEALAAVRAQRPGAPLLAVGVSLGGLILGNYLAAAGEAALVRAALIISSPLNVPKGSENIEKPYLNAMLSYHMTKNLQNTLILHSPLQEGPWDWEQVLGARSVRELDAAFTCKHLGFADVEAYYRAASLHDKLASVRVPLLCLCAADDPFQPMDVLPCSEALAARGVALLVPARGGHIGFLEGAWPTRAPHRQYVARLTAQYFRAILHKGHTY